MYDDLIKALRCNNGWGGFCYADCKYRENGLCELNELKVRHTAADAITSLSAQLAEKQKIVEAYAAAARIIALYLKPFRDDSLPYDEMIAEAARRADKALADMTAQRDAAVALIPHECRTCANWDKFKGLPYNCKKGGCRELMSNRPENWEYRGVRKEEHDG